MREKLVIKDKSNKDKLVTRSNYITYYRENDNIIRLARERDDDHYPRAKDFSGHNKLCSHVASIADTVFLPEDKRIILDFYFSHDSGESQRFTSEIFLRCPIIYGILEES